MIEGNLEKLSKGNERGEIGNYFTLRTIFSFKMYEEFRKKSGLKKSDLFLLEIFDGGRVIPLLYNFFKRSQYNEDKV